MKFEKLKTTVGKLKITVGKLINSIGKLTAGFVITNIIVGVGALIGMYVVGETGNAKVFFSCIGIALLALFNVLLLIVTGLLYKDDQTKIGKIVTTFAVVNTIVGLGPLVGTMIIEETYIKIFYSCAGMFFLTSFDALLGIMAGISVDVAE